VSAFFFCVVLSCVGRGLASGWSPVQGVLPTVQIDSEVQKLKFWTGTGRWPIPWRKTMMINLVKNIFWTDHDQARRRLLNYLFMNTATARICS
jgi:hypothetical protein